MSDKISFNRIVGGMKYDTQTATLLASDRYWDGHNFERSGRNTYLYRTPNGNFFTVNTTKWQGERDTLLPITQEEAVDLFEESLPEHYVQYHEAFPDVAVVPA